MRNFIPSKKRYFVYFFLFFPFIAEGEPGDLIEYNYQESFDLTAIEIGLAIVGGLGFATPEYTISCYDIKYESENSEGNLDTLSGLVVIPNSVTQAFPILSYQRGTGILDIEAPSISGLSLSNLEVFLICLIN